MLERAWNKKMIFQNYKVIALLAFMKNLQKEPDFLKNKITENKSESEVADCLKSFKIRIDLCKAMTE